jgi:hypothetical protein
MAEMVALAEIAKRLNLEVTAIRRLVARESDTLKIEIHRGKGDKVFLSRDDADRLIASYEARRGPIRGSTEETSQYDSTASSTLSSWYPKQFPIG